MADNTKITPSGVGVQFYKGVYGTGKDRNLPKAEGAIIFNETEQIIYVNGKPYGGACSVEFENGVLTITYSDGRAPQKLDFNDTASASGVYHVFERIDNLIGPNINVENGDGQLNYSGTKYLSEVKEVNDGEEKVTRKAAKTLVEADNRLDAAIKAVDTRIDNMNVESDSVGEGNVHIKYKQEGGKVTVESVTEDYATITGTRYEKAEGETPTTIPALDITKGDGKKLLKASDAETIKNYVDDRVEQLGDETKEAFDNLKAKDVATVGIGAHTTGEGEEATTTYDIEAGNVQDVLETLNTNINNLNTSSTLHLKHKIAGDKEDDAETVTADGSEYSLYQGNVVVAKFNIEKDSFVRTGEVVRGSLSGDAFNQDDNGEYYIHLVINTHDATTDTTAEKDVYIPAESLVDAYTANNKHTEGEGDEAKKVDNNVTITINNINNTISAVIKAAGVGTTELADGAVTFAKIDTANVQDGATASTQLTTKSYVDETVSTVVNDLDADFTNTSAAEGGSDKRAKDVKSNVAVSLKEENGIVTTLGVDVTYANITSAKDDENNTTLTGTDGLLIGTDVAKLVTFTNARITEEVAKLDAEVSNDEGEDQTETVKTTITETDGKLTSVSNSVLGAGVSFTAATETKEANLTATTKKGAILGSDITEIKNYIDVKSAKSTTTVTATTDDSLFVTEETGTDGHTNYDVKLVWVEWNDETQNA